MRLLAVLALLAASRATAGVVTFLDGDRLTVVDDQGTVVHVATGVGDHQVQGDLVAYRKGTDLYVLDPKRTLHQAANDVTEYRSAGPDGVSDRRVRGRPGSCGRALRPTASHRQVRRKGHLHGGSLTGVGPSGIR